MGSSGPPVDIRLTPKPSGKESVARKLDSRPSCSRIRWIGPKGNALNAERRTPSAKLAAANGTPARFRKKLCDSRTAAYFPHACEAQNSCPVGRGNAHIDEVEPQFPRTASAEAIKSSMIASISPSFSTDSRPSVAIQIGSVEDRGSGLSCLTAQYRRVRQLQPISKSSRTMSCDVSDKHCAKSARSAGYRVHHSYWIGAT